MSSFLRQDSSLSFYSIIFSVSLVHLFFNFFRHFHFQFFLVLTINQLPSSAFSSHFPSFCPKGIVKLMGRSSGFIAVHATLASGRSIADCWLLPHSYRASDCLLHFCQTNFLHYEVNYTVCTILYHTVLYYAILSLHRTSRIQGYAMLCYVDVSVQSSLLYCCLLFNCTKQSSIFKLYTACLPSSFPEI